MFRMNLRTLLILMAMVPPLMAVAWRWINPPRDEVIVRFFAGGDIRIESLIKP
jgi:hypothetical protein